MAHSKASPYLPCVNIKVEVNGVFVPLSFNIDIKENIYIAK
jgi:hypothetical protein